jgi:hypothetical protein
MPLFILRISFTVLRGFFNGAAAFFFFAADSFGLSGPKARSARERPTAGSFIDLSRDLNKSCK